jgi:hypothetical protein
MAVPTLPWSESIRYCGMIRNSATAANLYKKAKKGRRMSQAEIKMLEGFAERMVELVGREELVVKIDVKSVDGTVIDLSPELLIQGDTATLVVRGRWLVDTVTERCVGRWGDDDDESLTLFPNPVALVGDIARMIGKISSFS